VTRRGRRIGPAAVAFAATATFGPSSEAATLDDVLELALARAESPKIAVMRLEQAHAAVRSAWAALLPTLSVSGTYRRRAIEVAISRELDDGTTERSILQASDALSAEARLRSTLFEARALPDIGAAEDDVAVAEAAVRESRFLLAHQVADAYVTVRVAEGALAAARRRLDVAREDLAAVEERRRAGLAANLDRDRAELEAVEAEVAVTRAREAAQRSRVALEVLAAADIDAPLEPVAAPVPAAAPDELVTLARARRPEIVAARRVVQAAEDRALAPWLALVPTLGVDGVASATNETGFQGRTFNGNVALTLAWTLYDGGRRYAEARSAAAELEAAQLELARLERTVGSEVEDALIAVRAARAEVELADRRVEAARRFADEVRARAAQGLSTAVEAADAAVSLFEAEVQAATVHSELARATLELRRAAGRWPTDDEPAPAGDG
jgi:outer membrane protein TolC